MSNSLAQAVRAIWEANPGEKRWMGGPRFGGFEGMSGWVTDGRFLAFVGDSSPYPVAYKRHQVEHILGLAERAAEPLRRAQDFDVPTVVTEKMTTTTEVVEEGCSGCDCGSCLGTREVTKQTTQMEKVEHVGQTVFARLDGCLVRIDPLFGPLFDQAVGVNYDGEGMLVARDEGGRVMVVVMAIRCSTEDILDMAREHRAKPSPMAADRLPSGTGEGA